MSNRAGVRHVQRNPQTASQYCRLMIPLKAGTQKSAAKTTPALTRLEAINSRKVSGGLNTTNASIFATSSQTVGVQIRRSIAHSATERQMSAGTTTIAT